MKINELRIGALLQLNKAGGQYFTAEDPDTTVLVLEIYDGWFKALKEEIPDIRLSYAELRYFDVVSLANKKE